MSEKNTLRLRFLGAIGTVTGSCTLLEYFSSSENKKRYFLIDAGSFVNEDFAQIEERNKVLKYYAKSIEIIFITHAHLDHIGIIPDIIRYGFNGSICCTEATRKLIFAMLSHVEDSEQNYSLLKKVRFIDIDGRHGEKPNLGFGKTYIPITSDFRYGYLRSSHVLGSCVFIFQWSEKAYPKDTEEKEKEWKYVYFSGDIGPVSDTITPNILFKGYQTPYWDKYDKCIIMESTYGEKIRLKDNIFENKIAKLTEIIDSTISKGGTVIIPSFALDRAQQILLDLYLIYCKKHGNYSPALKNDYSWKELLENRNILVKYLRKQDKIGRYIETLDGADPKTASLRTLIAGEINKITSGKFKGEKYFNELSENDKNGIINIFEKSNVPKPSFMTSDNNLLNFSFYSSLIGKINNIYKNHLTDESYSNKDKIRKFKYLSDLFISEYFINPENEISMQKEEITKILSLALSKSKKETSIKVSASGMCDFGEVTSLLEKYLPDEKSTIILTGYQAMGTNGFLLKNLKEGKYDEDNAKEKISLKLQKDFLLADVKCNIEDLSDYYSGHADQEQLTDYVMPDQRNTGNITVLLNHGKENARNALKTEIEKKNKNLKVLLPKFNEWLNITSFEYEPDNIDYNKKIDTALSFRQIGDIHIYFPTDYNEEKIISIINYINELE
jgi:Cft2 family RNA processing exonuclease